MMGKSIDEMIDDVCAEYSGLNFTLTALSNLIRMMGMPWNENNFSMMDLESLMSSILYHADSIENNLMEILREVKKGGDV